LLRRPFDRDQRPEIAATALSAPSEISIKDGLDPNFWLKFDLVVFLAGECKDCPASSPLPRST
jgi:hypothetical protein